MNEVYKLVSATRGNLIWQASQILGIISDLNLAEEEPIIEKIRNDLGALKQLNINALQQLDQALERMEKAKTYADGEFRR